ncbi:MAG: ABC transporter ATP-binding protein [Verrucomicrobiales bacterium]|jgi:ABC-2 type transport system ATP-binding protein|nr:ABC transporter ATP-binding protein [Verrucomicrobiales bacterium]MBP9225123.1 ABC transporter ATP-binding protein [Verrucomicrobiales bacterium]HQZ28521.1 ABC transporter ATP-binding protein [Verrucomicrobiales bacterium]
MIEISNLSMRYGGLVALDTLNLKIERGEFFAFLGPNAAGKTTTIKLLTGLIAPTSGWSKICGFDIQNDPLEAKRRIGYIPDVAEFYDKLTPIEFMAFIAELFQVDPNAAKTRTGELMEQFSLLTYGRQRIENLSHGTRQRLAIASALLHDPEVIIIDEPMVGLDPKNARVVKEELKARSDAGVTIFLSTHLLNVAHELADRIGIINHGRLCALGTVEEIRAQVSGKGDQSLEEMFLEITGKGPEEG